MTGTRCFWFSQKFGASKMAGNEMSYEVNSNSFHNGGFGKPGLTRQKWISLCKVTK